MRPQLLELRVRNLGVIDDVTIELEPGMTALTGETGAGKTLLVEALGLLLGGRSDSSVVRAGTEEAVVEGRFLVPDGSLPPSAGADGALGSADDGGGSEQLTLARSIVSGGRSKAWIDGRMASVGALAEMAAQLIELHGQHQHQSLLHTEAQRRALDAFGRIDLTALEASRIRLRRLSDERSSLGGEPGERAREVELLRFQIEEIEGAGIEDGEEDGRLEREEDRLATASAHRHAAAAALAEVSGSEGTSAVDRLAEAAGALAGRTPLAAMEHRVRSAMADLSDLATELRTVVETWDDDPERLEAVRSRRQLLHHLARKYGGTLDDVLGFASEARARLAAVDLEREQAAALDAAIRSAQAEVAECEGQVAEARRASARGLAAHIESTLRVLAMPSARVSISVDGTGSADQVTFLLGANPGEALQPLSKAASGGELARTMLAIRLAVTDSPGVMVFDEVDAGVGGAAATSVGAALAGLGAHSQVLVVTHLAQVAAQADHQVEVRKIERSGRTRSEVTHLDADGRVVELSRMLSGQPDSASARRHARELLEGIPSEASSP